MKKFFLVNLQKFKLLLTFITISCKFDPDWWLTRNMLTENRLQICGSNNLKSLDYPQPIREMNVWKLIPLDFVVNFNSQHSKNTVTLKLKNSLEPYQYFKITTNAENERQTLLSGIEMYGFMSYA